MNDKFEMTGREKVVAYLRYYSGAYLKVLRKTRRNLCRDSGFVSRHSKLALQNKITEPYL
jgi:hypothetical protein